MDGGASWATIYGGHEESDTTERLTPPGPDGLLCVDYVPLHEVYNLDAVHSVMSAPRLALVLTFSISTITRPDYLDQGLGSDQMVILVCCEGSIDSSLS